MERVYEGDQEFRGGDWGVKYMFRGPEIDWGIILLKPGQAMGCHYHHRVEETFYIVGGNPILVVDGVEHAAEPYAAYRIPAPEKHDLVNKSEADAKIVFVKAPYDPKDKVDCK